MLIQCFLRLEPTHVYMDGFEHVFRDDCMIGDVKIPKGVFVCNINTPHHAERYLSFRHYKLYVPEPEAKQEDPFETVPRMKAEDVVKNEPVQETPIAPPEPPKKNKGGRPKKVKQNDAA